MFYPPWWSTDGSNCLLCGVHIVSSLISYIKDSTLCSLQSCLSHTVITKVPLPFLSFLFLRESPGNFKFSLNFWFQVATFLTIGTISWLRVSLRNSCLDLDFLLFCQKKKKSPSILFIAEFSMKCEYNPRECGNY